MLNNTGGTTNATSPVTATLTIPVAGDFTVVAKAVVDNTGTASTVNCTLTAGNSSDTAGESLADGDETTVPLMVAHDFTSPGKVILSCVDFDLSGSMDVSDMKVIATEATTLSNLSVDS